VYPISIDTPSVGAAASSATVTAKAHAFREGWGQPGTVFLGVDRLDYTKGIPHRLKAYEELLASGTVNADDVVFVQAASPSRENVASYQALSEEIDGLVAHINHTYIPANGRDALIYLRENLAREDMLALFVAADVMVVTSLADGMNLVAKEFVACRAENSGVLVLSVHAGAAEHMPEALLVDPYDISAIAQAMQESLRMGQKDIARRMARLRSEVSTHDVSAWAQEILGDLAR
jgi:trehalose 6-phosphate synthase